MKIVLYFLTAVTFLACNRTKQNDEPASAETQLLIDESLKFWNQTGNLLAEVRDGVLNISGADGMLTTTYVYEDFVLETEFLVDSTEKSAVFFRYFDDPASDSEFGGYEVIIDHNPNQQNTMGSIADISRAKILKGTKIDDWNKLVIEARGDHLKVFINDTLVTETHDRNAAEGKIALLACGNAHETKFRNMRITELEEEDYSAPLLEDYMRDSDKSEWVTFNIDEPSERYAVGDGIWDFKDGIIHGYSGEKGGFLIFKKPYRNFYLKFNFKIKYEDNSGIFIRHNPADSALVSTDNAIECNIYDHDGFLHEYSTGAIAPIARSWSRMIDYDSWNEMEIFAFEDQICMYVNGQKSSEAHLPESFNIPGNICIQAGIQVFNGNLPSDIYIKNMQIKDFDQVPYIGF